MRFINPNYAAVRRNYFLVFFLFSNTDRILFIYERISNKESNYWPAWIDVRKKLCNIFGIGTKKKWHKEYRGFLEIQMFGKRTGNVTKEQDYGVTKEYRKKMVQSRKNKSEIQESE